jgi:hypothetical protein
MLYSRVTDAKEQLMRGAKIICSALAGAAAALAVLPTSAQALDKVRFGTNWVA